MTYAYFYDNKILKQKNASARAIDLNGSAATAHEARRKLVGSTPVDIAKTRRRIEETLRKDTDDESIVRLAEELGIEVAYLPEQPENYHNEPGRPNFGPTQVRHASDLKIGQIYYMVYLNRRGKKTLRQKVKPIKLYCEPTTIYFGDREKEEVIDWYIDYVVMGSKPNIALSLYNINIHPYKLPGRSDWTAKAYLEFTEEQLCSCSVSYSGIQQK